LGLRNSWRYSRRYSILGVILIVIFVLAYVTDEPLRRKVERDMNARLKGYTVRVGKL